MDTEVERKGINASKLLQNAIKVELGM